jgi:hypothetical protein
VADTDLAERRDSGAAAGVSGRGFLLELQDVHFGYDPNRPVLKGVTLTVERGQVSLNTQIPRLVSAHRSSKRECQRCEFSANADSVGPVQFRIPGRVEPNRSLRNVPSCS